jgi:hypothetical protein
MLVFLLAPSQGLGGIALMLREETDSGVMRLAAKVWRKLFYREQWFLQIELPASGDLMTDFKRCAPLYPPPDRFWADPFVLSMPDAHYIFVEELPFSTGQGHIAVLELSRDGTLGAARKILERPYHLSYPFLFKWDGVLYMLPESGQNRTVELYRCTAFPDRWVEDRVLLSGVHSADATLVEHDGCWWMFMTQAAPGQSIHEHLYLYRADTPLGPFSPHPGNPVKSGLRGTRPAGALFRHEGALYRPTQDCARVYGEAVVVQRVDELTATRFHETEVGRMAPDRSSETRRLHTVNAGDGIRVMDALRWISK